MRYASFMFLFILEGSAFGQCSLQFPQDTVTIYFGYEPLECTDLQPAATGSGSIEFAWSNGDTTSAITVCDEVPTWYEVSITDSAGCSATDSVFVNVIDVHCGNNNDKVLVCHIPPGNPANAHTICISASGVPAHLAHGCSLGSCDSEGAQDEELQLLVSPNPAPAGEATIVLRSSIAQHVVLTAIDAAGRSFGVYFDADVAAGSTHTMQLDARALPEGSEVITLRVEGSSGRKAQRVVLIGR